MTQQVSIILTGGRVQAYPPTTAKVPTTPTSTTSTSAVALAEPPTYPTYPNPVLIELRALYDEIARLPAGHPGHRLKMERWKSLEHKLLGRSAP